MGLTDLQACIVSDIYALTARGILRWERFSTASGKVKGWKAMLKPESVWIELIDAVGDRDSQLRYAKNMMEDSVYYNIIGTELSYRKRLMDEIQRQDHYRKTEESKEVFMEIKKHLNELASGSDRYRYVNGLRTRYDG
jgi:hypothetical protein